MTEKDALEKAIHLAGGQGELARKVTAIAHDKGLLDRDKAIKQQHVHNWLNREGRTASKWALVVSEAVEFQVKPHSLRSDLYPVGSV